MIKMSVKISEMYGKPIFTGEGQRIGTVRDVIIDMEDGKAVRLTTEEMNRLSREELKTTLKDKSILYDRVMTVGDIVLLRRTGATPRTIPEEKSSSSSATSGFGSFMGQ